MSNFGVYQNIADEQLYRFEQQIKVEGFDKDIIILSNLENKNVYCIFEDKFEEKFINLKG